MSATTVQLFETTIIAPFDDENSYLFRALTVPIDSLADPEVLEGRSSDLLKNLELTELVTLRSPAQLIGALAVILARDESLEITTMEEEFGDLKEKIKEWTVDAAPNSAINAMTFERLIPFQESPIDLHSLGELALKATGVGFGAYIGFVAFAGTPFVMITVPAGMILCGAAAGFGRALEEGLRARILKLMGVPDSTKSHSPTPLRSKKQKSNISVKLPDHKRMISLE